MGNRNLRDLSDYARARVGLKVICRSCGHEGVLNPWRMMTALMLVQKRYWISEIEPMLRCRKCGVKDARAIPHQGRDR